MATFLSEQGQAEFDAITRREVDRLDAEWISHAFVMLDHRTLGVMICSGWSDARKEPKNLADLLEEAAEDIEDAGRREKMLACAVILRRCA
jgi:hypothetical protein